MNWLSVSAENIVILILLLALAIKFIFFEDKGDITKQLRFQEDNTENVIESEIITTEKMDVSLRRRFEGTIQRPIFPLSEINSDWIEVINERNIELVDKEIQTDEKVNSTDTSSNKDSSHRSIEPRNLEECLEIYQSEVSKKYF